MNLINNNLDIRHIDLLIDMAISEDIGPGDITTNNLPDRFRKGTGRIVAKEFLVLAGMDILKKVFCKFEDHIDFSTNFNDGDTVKPKDIIAEVQCSIGTLLMGERTALNFLQRLSGIATNVRKYTEEMGNAHVRLVDTRKTIPGWRVLEKYAVRAGGGYNHRMGLYDGVLIKDNHIEVFGGIKNAISHIRNAVSHFIKIEIETATLDEVKEALDAGADIIMLDNMNLEQIKAAVDIIGNKALIEVSGRVDKKSLKSLLNTGIDIVSAGALTHSASFVDISMEIILN